MSKDPPYRIQTKEEAGLWMMPAPTFRNGLEETLRACADLDLKQIASLVEPEERVSLGLEDLQNTAAAHGIEICEFPMVDRHTPENLPAFKSLSHRLFESFRQGNNVGVHCKSGIGRSGMVIAAILNKLGYSFEEALQKIAEGRGLDAPNTASQLTWLKNHWGEL